MSEILFQISDQGLIKQQYICYNCKTFNQVQSIHSILEKDASIKLKSFIDQNTNELFIDNTLINNELHFLYIHSIGNQYLLYANTMKNITFKESMIHLITAFAKQYMMPIQNYKEESKFLYENIQKLNNELVNKQRETSKLNHQLNHLNQILNNRLVKDPLTKLVSRYQYRDEILLNINKNPRAFGLFWFIDVDDFKSVNDTYGHQIGDEFLIEVAKRLNQLPFDDTVKMRIAGDEFGIFIANIKKIDNDIIKDYYRVFSETVIKPIVVNGDSIEFSCSTGIAIYNKDSSELNQLIDYADSAMYHAKDNGKNQYQLFDIKSYYIRDK